MTTNQIDLDLAQLNKELAQIKLLVLDVDGVLSDGKLYFTATGDEIKNFSILDGLGIKQLMQNGVEVAIITGRTSAMVSKRASDLGIQHLIQGREDKRIAMQELLESVNLELDSVAYMGDDLPDLGAIVSAKVGITVPNGHPFVKEHANYCTQASGGNGAVREVCDLILNAKGVLQDVLNQYLPPSK